MEKKFCYRCMENYDGFKTVCPHCGYDENSSYNNMYLAPGTVLHERYLVGILINFNGEGATYIAYDKVMECKVLLREYMPVNLCTRVEGKPTISVNYNNLAKYKAFMAEYTELNKSLARLRNNTNINPTLDMFAENNTTYTIFEYIEGCKLLDYLKQNAGELTWEQVSKLLPPLFTTIGIIHNAGIIHRAISPDTVYVTSKGEIKLSGFCISSVRTIGGGLEPELFKGYAAPEQYSSNISSRQGTWTDVYGLSALLYRILTGCMPTESIERTESDNLCEPYILNKNIPKQVSRTIMDGLNVLGGNRIQTITEFVTRLFEQNDEDVKIRNTSSFNTRKIVNQVSDERTAEYTKNYNTNSNYNNYNNPLNPPPPPEYSDAQRNYRNNYNDYNNNNNNYTGNDNYDYENENFDSNSDGYEYEKVNTIDKIKIPLIIGILLFAILMILGITLMHVLSPSDEPDESSVNFASMNDNVIEATTTAPEESIEPEEVLDAIVPDLIGKFIELTTEKYIDFITLEPEYEYNDDYVEGQIFWQEFESGTPFHMGSVMKVKVSLGSANVTIPDYYGYTVSEYTSMLSNSGIDNYLLVEDYDASDYTEPNHIVKLEVNGNEVYVGDLINSENGEQLTVYYKPEEVVTTAESGYEPEEITTTTVTEDKPVVTETEQVTEPPVVTEPASIENNDNSGDDSSNPDNSDIQSDENNGDGNNNED